jgi:hypothetical protein
VFTTSTTSPHTYEQEVQKINPKLKTIAISSRNSDSPEIREILSSPNQMIEDYDVILLSPTVKAGFSFDKPVKRVFARFTGGVVARDFCQMILRCRNVQDKNIVTYVSESKGEYNTNPKYLKKLALKKASVTEEHVDSSMIQFSIDPVTRDREALDPELLDIWVHFEQERRETENNRLKAFLHKCMFHGWTFSEVDEDVSEEQAEELKESSRIAREAVEAERQEWLMAAEIISEDEAERIDNAHTRTADDKANLERYKLEDFYGQEISKELIEKDKKGKTRRIVRDWEVFHRWQKGDKNAAAIKDFHNTANKHVTEYRHTMLRMAKFDNLVRLGLQCSLEDFEGKVITKEELAETFEEYLSKASNRQSIQEVLGSKCTAATAENPSKWFFELTKKVGAKWVSSRKRVNGELVREYTLDLTDIRGLAKAENLRINEMVEEFNHDIFEIPQEIFLMAA